MIKLDGKVVFVTGASRGIGAVCVRSLLDVGASVAAHLGRSGQGGEALVEEFGADRVHLLSGDLAREGEAVRLFQAVAAWQGRVDVLVNNAGIAPPVTVDDSLEAWSAVWRETLQVNLLSVADTCREAIGHFRGQGGGIIIRFWSLPRPIGVSACSRPPSPSATPIRRSGSSPLQPPDGLQSRLPGS